MSNWLRQEAIQANQQFNSTTSDFAHVQGELEFKIDKILICARDNDEIYQSHISHAEKRQLPIYEQMHKKTLHSHRRTYHDCDIVYTITTDPKSCTVWRYVPIDPNRNRWSYKQNAEGQGIFHGIISRGSAIVIGDDSEMFEVFNCNLKLR